MIPWIETIVALRLGATKSARTLRSEAIVRCGDDTTTPIGCKRSGTEQRVQRGIPEDLSKRVKVASSLHPSLPSRAILGFSQVRVSQRSSIPCNQPPASLASGPTCMCTCDPSGSPGSFGLAEIHTITGTLDTLGCSAPEKSTVALTALRRAQSVQP